MKYLQKSFMHGQPSKVTACERCVYARGLHAAWCPERPLNRLFVACDAQMKAFFPPRPKPEPERVPLVPVRGGPFAGIEIERMYIEEAKEISREDWFRLRYLCEWPDDAPNPRA